MYEYFKELCDKKGIKPAQVARETGIAKATLTEWKKGTYTPKQDKLQLIADYFNVSLEYLMTGQHPEHESTSGRKYYFDDETAATAQELFFNPHLHALLSAARGKGPESVDLATEMLMHMKDTNPDG